MVATFTDSGQILENFAETMYVHCPRCNKLAYVIGIPSDEEKVIADVSRRFDNWRMSEFSNKALDFGRMFSARKLSCLHCGHTKTWQCNVVRKGGPFDWYFGLPLWLQTPCCGDILWALNREHLSFLESYVGAKQRIKFSRSGSMRNNTMASRLPLWMKSAKNRQEILRGIARLKTLLETS